MILLNLDAASSLAPCGVCTWSLSERACQFVIIMWLMRRETSYTSLRMCRNILKYVSTSLCIFFTFWTGFDHCQQSQFPHQSLTMWAQTQFQSHKQSALAFTPFSSSLYSDLILSPGLFIHERWFC